MRMRIVAVVTVLSVMGCGGEEGAIDGSVDGGVSPPVSCDGPAPESLEECEFVGDGFADCGGRGEPRLACGHGCRWYLGGCVPRSETPSPCTVGDPCCVDGYPFPLPADVLDRGSLDAEIRQHAGAVWSQTREANVAVTLDPTVEPPSEVSVTCEGECVPEGFSICRADREGSPLVVMQGPLLDDTPGFQIRWGVTFSGRFLAIEIVPGEDGALRARVLHTEYTDVLPTAPACPFTSDPRTTLNGAQAAEGGTLVLDRLPSPDSPIPHGRMQLRMRDCFTIDAVF